MKINSIIRQAALLFAFAMATTFALADQVRLNLTGSSEVPPISTKAAGAGVFTIGKDMSVSGGIATTAIVGTAAHIHIGKAGTNGPVAIGLIRNGDNGWLVPPDAKFTEEQYQAYLAGDLYVNVHSAEHKAGEIRSQLAAPVKVSMPASGY
jgi:hypothetical protein